MNQFQKHIARIRFAQTHKSNGLVRPDTCELCGAKPPLSTVNQKNGATSQRSNIVAHHANGYEDLYNVWWICQSCNRKLIGHIFHSGYVTKEQAKSYLRKKARQMAAKKANQCRALVII